MAVQNEPSSQLISPIPCTAVSPGNQAATCSEGRMAHYCLGRNWLDIQMTSNATHPPVLFWGDLSSQEATLWFFTSRHSCSLEEGCCLAWRLVLYNGRPFGFRADSTWVFVLRNTLAKVSPQYPDLDLGTELKKEFWHNCGSGFQSLGTGTLG